MAVDEREVPVSVARSDSSVRSGNNQERLESLLLDDLDKTRSIDHIVEQEVKVVKNGKVGRSGSLLVLLLLLCTLLLGMGYYYYLCNASVKQSSATQLALYVSPRLPIPQRPKLDLSTAVTAAKKNPASKSEIITSTVSPVIENEVPLYIVTVGPFVNAVELERAVSQLQELGLHPQKRTGRGQVSMIRLLEGIYPEEEARQRLERLKKVSKSAFLLPDNNNLAVYAGSFHEESRARQMQDDLVKKRVNVTLVDSITVMKGTMLMALHADQQTAREVAAHISRFGLQTQVIKKR